MDKVEENNEVLKVKIREILRLGIGLSVEVSGSLYIRELDCGDYAVGGTEGMHKDDFVIPQEGEPWPIWEEVISSLDKAIDLFIEKRNADKYGEDFWSSREE